MAALTVLSRSCA